MFKEAVTNRFEDLVYEITTGARVGDSSVGNLKSADSDGVNLKYYAKNNVTGKTVTNIDLNGIITEKGISRLPAGYDYYLYFDGEKFTAGSGGKSLDIYREDSGYWGFFSYYLAGSAFSGNLELKDTRVLLIVKESLVKNPYTYSYIYNTKVQADYGRMAIYGILALFLLSLFLIVLSIIKRESRRKFTASIAKVTGWFWFEVKIILSIIIWLISIRLIKDSSIYIYNFYLTEILALEILFWWFYLVMIDLLNNRKWVFTNNSINSIIKLYKKLENNKPFQKYMLQRAYMVIAAEAILVFFAIASAIAAQNSETWSIPFLLLVAVCAYLLYRYMGRYTKTIKNMGHLVDQVAAIKCGDTATKYNIEPGDELFTAQENLNLIQESINKAVEEKTRSERMKVELITNVSHDLKTPLTSIISYVDLLTREPDLPHHVVDYIRVLSQKSERLKALIQDLFELSKATSGDIKLDIEKLDLGKLIRQTLADMDEQVVQSGLAFKVNLPEEPVFVLSDGSKLYRVFQNLYSNALKYSLAGSRVYTDLMVKDAEVYAIIKNTSSYEMNFNEEEILERFVRGDQARSTEGSGLGLAIAQNFTQNCGGQLQIKVDGDLFKVIVSFKVLNNVISPSA